MVRPTVDDLPAPADKKVSFARDVMPILQESCFDCHGRTKGPEGEYSLVTRERAIQGGENGTAIVPGNSLESPLILHVAGIKQRMPPSNRKRSLTGDEIATLRAWIDQGVDWPVDAK